MSEEKKNQQIPYWISFLVAIFAIIIFAFNDLGEYSLIMGAGFGVAFYVYTLIINRRIKKQQQEEEAAEKAKEEEAAEKARKERSRLFYEACKQQSIYNLDSPKDFEKARLIGRQKGVFSRETDDQIRKFFDTAKQEARVILVEKEKEQYANSIKYLNLHGRRKPIKYYRELQQQYENAAKSQQELGRMMVNSVAQQKEMDWATHGGIASAIAGPAAGMATALDIQEKNRQIREENQRNRSAAINFSAQMSLNSYKTSAQAEEYKRIADSYETKLVEDKENYFDKIVVLNKIFSKTESGSIEVSVSVIAKEPIIIYNDVRAVIDGALSLKLSCNGNELGKIFLVLPIDGLKGIVKLESIWVNSLGKDVSGVITGELDNYDTWAIETDQEPYSLPKFSSSNSTGVSNKQIKKIILTENTAIEKFDSSVFTKPQIQGLKAKGITTVGALFNANDQELLQVKGIGQGTVRNWNNQKSWMKDGTHYRYEYRASAGAVSDN